jgi:hypothetical protein
VTRHLLIVSSIALAGFALADPPATQPAQQKEIKPIIEKLAAEDFPTRNSAQAQMEQLDSTARPMLLAVMKETKDDDVRTRIEAALHKIDDNGKTAPTFVALDLKDVTARQAFAELARQGNVRIDVSDLEREHEPRFSIDLSQRPFWQAMRELCVKTGLQPEMRGDPPQIVIDSLPTRWSNRPASVHGPFLVVADRLERDYKVDLSRPDELQHRFILQLTAFSDPRLLVMKNAREVKLEEAVDERGNSLLPPPERDFVPETSEYRPPWEWRLVARLHRPDGAGQKIARLRGSAQFLVRTGFQPWELTQIMTVQNATRMIGGCRLTIEGLTKNEEGFTLRIRGEGPLCGLSQGGMSDQFEAIRRSIRLIDNNGRNFAVDFAGGSGRDEWSYLFTFKPTPAQDATAEPSKLVWDVPTEAKFLVVPFEFSNLPLP